MVYAASAIIGYLLGSFPTGVVLTRRKYGIDVREMGSGNIGATNVTRAFGWYAGIWVFIIDYLKGFVPLYVIDTYFPQTPWLMTTTAAALVLGHCFSIFLKFHGGKGVATSFGCLTFVAPWCALLAAVVYAGLLASTKISAIGSLGAILSALTYLAIKQPDLEVTSLILGISLVVTIRHHQNIKRLIETWKKKRGN